MLNKITKTYFKCKIKKPKNYAKVKHAALATSLSLLFVSSVSANQDESLNPIMHDDSDIEKIVITADLSRRNLSELPITALTLNQEEMNKRQARHLQDIINMVPNLNFSAGASRGKFIQIRGIGERSQFAEPINPSIGILLDDIDISGLGGLATVYDLRQVEVLSGPQSVSTGLNSLGGIVKLVSNEATSNLYLDLTASYAQFNEHRLAGTYNNALTDNISARLSIQNTQSDGFVKNQFLNREDTNGTDELSVSARFNIGLGENGQLDANFYHFDIENGYDAFSLDNDNISQADEPGIDNLDAQAASLKYSYNFASFSLQATLSGINAKTEYGYDEDWTYAGFHEFGYTSFDLYLRDITRRSFDLKFATRTEEESDSTFLIGFNLSRHEEDSQRIYTFEGDYASKYKPTTDSIYGQYEMSLSDNVGLTAAARAEQFKADFFDNQGLLTQIDDKLFAASLALDYQLAENLLFVNVSKGYKAGGFNIDQRLSPSN